MGYITSVSPLGRRWWRVLQNSSQDYSALQQSPVLKKDFGVKKREGSITMHLDVIPL